MTSAVTELHYPQTCTQTWTYRLDPNPDLDPDLHPDLYPDPSRRMKALSPVRALRSCHRPVCCVSERSLSIGPRVSGARGRGFAEERAPDDGANAQLLHRGEPPLPLERRPLMEQKGTQTWSLGPGAWDLEPGTWSLGPGAWDLEPGTWSLGPGAWNLESGTWSLGPGVWDLEPGTWSLGPGAWDLEPGTCYRLLPVSP
uniref:Uncharacterized protein n=1 Tax=Knipowitschia caucasica TaxID=637954 RepID=A0AAV2JJP8_KNICA